LATVLTASERRKRLKLKRIVISEHNYLALKKAGYAGDSFNDVVSRLLQVIGPIKKRRSNKRNSSRSNNEKTIIKNTLLTMTEFLFLAAFWNCLVSTIDSN
jgi:predicted CopG family antitoxin